jgi:hypothetical protein
MNVEDLIQVLGELGYRYEVDRSDVEHYQWICPPCRRAMFAISQGRLSAPSQTTSDTVSKSTYANPGSGQGPLGEEDKANFHP